MHHTVNLRAHSASQVAGRPCVKKNTGKCYLTRCNVCIYMVFGVHICRCLVCLVKILVVREEAEREEADRTPEERGVSVLRPWT